MSESTNHVYPKAAAGEQSANVAPNPSFPKLEESVLDYWDKDGTFQKSIERRPSGDHSQSEFVFFDGPPFANGLPHYGHLLTGYAKDVIPRYQTMKGHRVNRVFGWDTHGLPAELEAQKELGIDSVDQIKELAMVNYGGILSPFNAWLVARGLSTVPLRMKQHSAVAMKVAEFLESCPATRFVWYPGLKSHPQHERAEKLMHGEYSGMISFDLKGDEKQHEKFLDALKLVTHAVSLGDIETLIVYYDRNSDKLPHYPAVYQEGFFRFSIGLEDAEDIIADLTQAMQAAGML